MLITDSLKKDRQEVVVIKLLYRGSPLDLVKLHVRNPDRKVSSVVVCAKQSIGYMSWVQSAGYRLLWRLLSFWRQQRSSFSAETRPFS